MSLSVGNRRAIQTQSTLGIQSQHSVTFRSRQEQPRVGVQKQRSFFTSGNADITCVSRDFMRRGVSVGRSFDVIRQRPGLSLENRKNLGPNFQRQLSLSEQPASNSKLRKDPFRSKYFGSLSRYAGNESISELTRPSNNAKTTAWSSTSSLLKSFEEELSQNKVKLDQKKSNAKSNTATNNIKSSNQIPSSSSNDELKKIQSEKDTSTKHSTSDPNKFNLSIVLSQTIEAISENDVDSASEGAEPEKHSKITVNKNLVSSVNRRSQFQQSNTKNQTITSSNDTNLSLVASSSLANNNVTVENNLNVVPLTIQRRPPLVRAMSAPVRSLDDNSKSIIGGNKRKSRRRKISSGYSPDKLEINNSGQNDADLNLNLESATKSDCKKGLSRSNSALTPDVITLVSLVSSEGSDSERDDAETFATTNSARRAPSLRRTGKSVSFQENDPPNYQFTSKEFPTMRRGSIVQLAARIRANRPLATSPVSIFLAEAYNCDRNLLCSSSNDNESNIEAFNSERRKMSLIQESENDSANDKAAAVEDDYPEYVRTLKERECWKLFQKMSKKGVVVTYDTILRGMLTPTEFRQLQKHREVQEAKARKAEIEKEAEQAEKKPAATAIERLSEVLLKK